MVHLQLRVVRSLLELLARGALGAADRGDPQVVGVHLEAVFVEALEARQEHLDGLRLVVGLAALAQQGAVAVDGLGRHRVVVEVLPRLVHGDLLAAAGAGDVVAGLELALLLGVAHLRAEAARLAEVLLVAALLDGARRGELADALLERAVGRIEALRLLARCERLVPCLDLGEEVDGLHPDLLQRLLLHRVAKHVDELGREPLAHLGLSGLARRFHEAHGGRDVVQVTHPRVFGHDHLVDRAGALDLLEVLAAGGGLLVVELARHLVHALVGDHVARVELQPVGKELEGVVELLRRAHGAGVVEELPRLFRLRLERLLGIA